MGWQATIIALVVSVLFFATLGALFWNELVIALVNGVILYILLYRAYFDLREGRLKPYLIGLVVGAIVVFFMPPLPPLWPITLVVMLNFAVVEILRVAVKGKKRKR